jgi:hypothetical protein
LDDLLFDLTDLRLDARILKLEVLFLQFGLATACLCGILGALVRVLSKVFKPSLIRDLSLLGYTAGCFSL